MSRITSSISAVVTGSSPVVGSSKRRISGTWAIARAKPTRRRMPPESCEGSGRRSRRAAPAPGTPRPARRISSLRLLGQALQGEGDVLPDRHRVEERALLEGHAELAPELGERAVVEPGDRHAVDLDRAGVGLQQPDDVLQEHALARPRGADDDHRLALGDVEVDAVQHHLGAERLLETPDGDLRAARGRSAGAGRPSSAGPRTAAWSGRSRRSGWRSRRRPRRLVVERPTPSAPPVV